MLGRPGNTGWPKTKEGEKQQTVIRRRCAQVHNLAVTGLYAGAGQTCLPPTLLCPEAPVSVLLPTVYFGGHCLHMKLVCSWRRFLACQVYTLHLGLPWSKNVNATPAGPTPSPARPSAALTSRIMSIPLDRRVSKAPLPSLPNLLPA